MANPYILPSITGNIRAGVNRFLTNKAATADEERKRKLAIEQENQKFDRDMALMRFRSDLNTQGEIGRLRAADQLHEQSWQEGRFDPTMPEEAPREGETRKMIENRQVAGIEIPEGWRRTQANLKQQQAEGLVTHRADEQIRVKKTPGATRPAGSRGRSGGSGSGGGGGGSSYGRMTTPQLQRERDSYQRRFGLVDGLLSENAPPDAVDAYAGISDELQFRATGQRAQAPAETYQASGEEDLSALDDMSDEDAADYLTSGLLGPKERNAGFAYMEQTRPGFSQRAQRHFKNRK
jgi:hypothetical protein